MTFVVEADVVCTAVPLTSNILFEISTKEEFRTRIPVDALINVSRLMSIAAVTPSTVRMVPEPPPERNVLAVSIPRSEMLLFSVKFPTYVPGLISIESTPATALVIASLTLV
jgi:hypothetical protein